MFFEKWQIDLIKELIEKDYPFKITSIGKIVHLNTTEIGNIDMTDNKIYFGTIVTPDSNGAAVVQVKTSSTTKTIFDNTTAVLVGLSNSSTSPFALFNHSVQVATVDGNIYFFGIEFEYTEIV